MSTTPSPPLVRYIICEQLYGLTAVHTSNRTENNEDSSDAPRHSNAPIKTVKSGKTVKWTTLYIKSNYQD